MGFSEGAVVKSIGQGSHPQNTMWDHEVNCTGTENSIKSCPSIERKLQGVRICVGPECPPQQTPDQANCDSSHNVGITCSSKGNRHPVTNPNMRLININDGLIIAGEECGGHSKPCGVCIDGQQFETFGCRCQTCGTCPLGTHFRSDGCFGATDAVCTPCKLCPIGH